MIRLLLTFLLVGIFTGTLFAQHTGTLSGKVLDTTGQPIPFANVAVKQNGSVATGTQTDFDGFYTIKALPPGTYDVEISLVGFKKSITNALNIIADSVTPLNKVLSMYTNGYGHGPIEYKRPLLNSGQTDTSHLPKK